MATKYKGKIVSAQGEGGPVYKFREVQPGEHPAVVYNVVLEGGGDIRNQDKTITENGQYTADAGYTGLGTVTVDVESQINNQDKTITQNGVYTADEGFTGLGEVTVNVPSVEPTGTISITQNGNYDVAQYANANVNVSGGAIPNYIAPKNNVNGVYKPDNTATSFSLNGATDIVSYALYSAFESCPNLTSVDLSSLIAISGERGMAYCFHDCTGLTSIDLSSLTTISGNGGMSYCFYSCTRLTSVDLSSLTTIAGTAMTACFLSCPSLTSVDLSSLTTVNGSSAMNGCFSSCPSLTSVDLSSLTTISGNSAMASCFSGCTGLTELRFPALQSFGTSTTTVNQFSSMLQGVTGCTLRFPSNMQSEVERRTGFPNFGGTNTVVLFNLPPTA